MEKLIITAAICGAEVTKEQNPAVPYTVEEIVREAKSAVDAGAAIVHLHVREDDGTPTQSKERFKECIDAIYKVCPDVIIIPSTGGAVGMPLVYLLHGEILALGRGRAMDDDFSYFPHGFGICICNGNRCRTEPPRKSESRRRRRARSCGFRPTGAE